MAPDLRECLLEYIGSSLPVLLGRHRTPGLSPPLFPNQRGERLTRQWIWSVLNTAAEQAGLVPKVGHHTLRHSFAVRQLEQGTSMEHLREIMGIQAGVSMRVYSELANIAEVLSSP